MRLQDKVALITGAGSGQGRAAALLFAREGAKVVVADNRADAGQETVWMIRNGGAEATFVQTDVSVAGDVENMVNFTLHTYSKLDILYNNAGILWFDKDTVVTTIEEQVWDRIIAVNLKGVYLGCKYAIPVMIKNGGGSIINTSSIAGLKASWFHAYAAAKAGVIALTRSAAVSFAPYKIRVNAICPGSIRTPMIEDFIKDSQRLQNVLDNTPIGRIGTPEDVAYLALYLASDESVFMTGAVLPIDGGWSAT